MCLNCLCLKKNQNTVAPFVLLNNYFLALVAFADHVKNITYIRSRYNIKWDHLEI